VSDAAQQAELKSRLSGLSPSAKRRLRAHACDWCDQRLISPDCGAIYVRCTPADRAARAADCLAESKNAEIAAQAARLSPLARP
jgi:hypothetical protein